MADIRRMFSTPCALERIDADVEIAVLRSAILDERARDPEGIARSNTGGWHSATTLQHWGGDAAHALARQVAAIADSMTLDVRDRSQAAHRWRADMWANVIERDNGHQFHYHPGCIWSAVAYLDDGYEGGDGRGSGGELVFLDPRMPQVRMNSPHLVLRETDGEEQLVEPFVRPATGLLVVFPAWLAHGVRPFRGGGSRISAVINLSAG